MRIPYSRREIYSVYVDEDEILTHSLHPLHGGLSLFLWENHAGFDKITGSGMAGDRVSGELLLPFSKLFADDADSETCFGLQEENIPEVNKIYSTTVHLNDRIRYRVELLRAEGLPKPSISGFTGTVSRMVDTTASILQFGQAGLFIPTVTADVRDCYIKASLVKWNGEIYIKKYKSLRSSVVKGTLNPLWNAYDESGNQTKCSKDAIFYLAAEDGLQWAEFVRLELFDARNAASALQEEVAFSCYVHLLL